MASEMELFMQLPELLLIGNNDSILYDREEITRKYIDGIQRTSNIVKFKNCTLLLNDQEIPEIIKI